MLRIMRVGLIARPCLVPDDGQSPIGRTVWRMRGGAANAREADGQFGM